MVHTMVVMAVLLPGSLFLGGAPERDYPIQPVPFTDVRIQDGFWTPRQETNSTVTVPYCFKKCEETGRITNFAKAGKLMEGPFEGIFFNDSDVYKVIEGAAYTLMLAPDPKLDAYLDDLIAKITAAQEPDGYLYTSRTIDPEHPQPGSGKERWSNLASSHELYNIGHLYEAAVAHYLATGKTSLLDVAKKSADFVDTVFGPNAKHDVPGHQEIEIGLVRLYRVTGEVRYLNLAKFFLDQRGQPSRPKLYGPYQQDHLPVIEQREAVGHSVRAGYMYSGMADVASLTGDEAYLRALDAIWEDVVSKKIYITGGTAAKREGEAFGAAYELPNKEAYNETCAAIANVYWNARMFLLHGDSKYVDVLERTLYNGFLAGVSMSGDRYFYPNPLECDNAFAFNHGTLCRNPWFDCSCCPVNVVRIIPALSGYVYAVRDDSVYVNLFIGGEGKVKAAGTDVTLTQSTQYPWDGAVDIAVAPGKAAEFALLLRVPCWATGSPMASDLYRYVDAASAPVTFAVNGAAVTPEMNKGYAVLRRAWKAGDTVHVEFPMAIRRVLSNDKVTTNAGRVALERGPLVYCIEGVDHGGHALNVALTDDAGLSVEKRGDLLGGVTVLRGKALAKEHTADGKAETTKEIELTAVPYYAWAHRGEGEMEVWLPRDAALATAPALPTIAGTSKVSASHVNGADSLRAVNDQIEPKNSNDQGIPRFTWWDHRGKREWVQYEFKETKKVSRVDVYWFDDTGAGQCRVPQTWRVLYRVGEEWKPVEKASEYGVARDAYNAVTFAGVETNGLRVEVELQPEFSGGVLEWRVGE
ncbi:MAG: glycoside hydrolase family 127 protein [Candidatus Hydrogenedentales bacterium]|jgi:hypothetical protein